jgi:hypothetical protein
VRIQLEPPASITEFNTIVGLIFAQLYEAFPVSVDLIDRDGIARVMGVTGDWSAHRALVRSNLQ